MVVIVADIEVMVQFQLITMFSFKKKVNDINKSLIDVNDVANDHCDNPLVL